MLHASAHDAIYAFHSYSQVLSRLHYTLVMRSVRHSRACEHSNHKRAHSNRSLVLQPLLASSLDFCFRAPFASMIQSLAAAISRIQFSFTHMLARPWAPCAATMQLSTPHRHAFPMLFPCLHAYHEQNACGVPAVCMCMCHGTVKRLRG